MGRNCKKRYRKAEKRMKIKIGNKYVGEDEPAYIILEIARTYENDIEKAKKMIKIAAESGADAVKIQSIDAKGLLINNEKNKEYYSKLKKLERTKEEHVELMKCCKENNIEFLSTPESFETINILDEIGVNAYKVASLDLTYSKFLKHMARKNKPIILSTGMASEEEIKKAIEVIKKEGNEKIILLHCVSLYPPEIKELNLAMINRIKNFNVLPGFSDHTPDIKASLCAIALGAKVIEKHFKIDSGEGSEWKGDYDVAINPEQAKELAVYAKQLAKSHKSIKELPDREVERRKVRGRKIVANKNLSIGDEIKEEDIICLQNLENLGIDCDNIEKIIGKKLKRNISKGEILEEWDIELNR